MISVMLSLHRRTRFVQILERLHRRSEPFSKCESRSFHERVEPALHLGHVQRGPAREKVRNTGPACVIILGTKILVPPQNHVHPRQKAISTNGADGRDQPMSLIPLDASEVIGPQVAATSGTLF